MFCFNRDYCRTKMYPSLKDCFINVLVELIYLFSPDDKISGIEFEVSQEIIDLLVRMAS